MHSELWKILIAAGLLVFSYAVYRRTFPPLSAPRRALLIAMRGAAFALLGLLLLNPSFVSSRVEVRPPLVVALVDHSKSMGIRDANGVERLAAATRGLELFRRALREGTNAEIAVIPFADVISPGPLPEDSVLSADAEGTDIRGALEAAQRRYRSENLAAIVLLTDGRITRGMASSGDDITVPVYAVGFGDTLEKADVSIEEIIYERAAYRGTKVPIEAVIRVSGLRGRSLEVRLMEGGRPRAGATITGHGDAGIVSSVLEYVPAEEGEHRLSVEILPVEGEERRENNVESFRIDVFKDKLRILFIDQFPDWNTAFFRSLARRSKRMEIEAVSWKPERGFVAGPEERGWAFPSSGAGLAPYDLVIISDDAMLFNARANTDALERYCAAGGSVLFLADENSPLARGASFELLRVLLPLERMGAPRVDFSECFVRAPEEGAGDEIASMLSEEGALDALPPLAGRIAGLVPTAGARVPLVLEDRGGSSPFLLIARHGEGVSSAILGFPLWRWRLAGPEGERVYESFLGSLVQYLAEGARSSTLTLDSDRTVYRAGDRIRFTVSMGVRRIPEGIRGEVRGKGEGDIPVSTFVFEPDPRKRGSYRAEAGPLPPGEYTAAATELAASGGGMTGRTSFSVLPASVEFLRTSRDGAFLDRVAQGTRGMHLEGAELPGLAARLDLKEEKLARRTVTELRGNILIFIGIVAFLALEWTLRKIWGLV